MPPARLEPRRDVQDRPAPREPTRADAVLCGDTRSRANAGTRARRRTRRLRQQERKQHTSRAPEATTAQALARRCRGARRASRPSLQSARRLSLLRVGPKTQRLTELAGHIAAGVDRQHWNTELVLQAPHLP